ncbi:hypothetical protein [Accumulibacter sp.]|uniref:hypothetical protein n=1 Tax=Accumulibacter sp. TaxID=2053492 RepID=UPI002C88BE04|nr:hypothetical protein [Accumulibacter sp.]HPU81512.1 hypothetical protein [Accumulibacter sp.]
MEIIMTKTRMLALMAFNLMMAGCVSDQQLLADDQANAVNVATRRGQFELTCPTATGILLSSNLLQPVLWNGIERAEYTVGVEGCGQKSTYVVVCQVNSVSCFAVSGHNNAFSQ